MTGASALIVLDEIDNTISKQLQSIDNLLTNAIGNTGNMLLSVSARLRKDINETIGNTDKVLRENQLTLYNELINLKDEYNQMIAQNLDKLDGTATKITEALNNFLITKKEPRIFKFISAPFIKGYTPYHTLTVSGKNFDKSRKVYVLINGKKIQPLQLNYQEAVFRIDSADVRPAADSFLAKGQVVFEWEKGLFRKDMIDEDPFMITVTPYQIGSATVYFEQEKPERKYTDYISYSCNCRTGQPGWSGGRRESSTSFNIVPTGGRLFDVSATRIDNWDQRHGGGHHFTTQTEQQIAGYITCRSESRPRGARGTSHLTFSYREYEIIYRIHQNLIAGKTITSVNPLIFELPDPVDGKRPNLRYVSVRTFDGKDITILPNATNKYFSVQINPVTDDVAVNFKH